MKIAPKQCISWKTCGGVEEFCKKQGINTLTINSNSFYSSFQGSRI